MIGSRPGSSPGLAWAAAGFMLSMNAGAWIDSLLPEALMQKISPETGLILVLAEAAAGVIAGFAGYYFYDRKIRALREDPQRERDHRIADWMEGLQYVFIPLILIGLLVLYL